MTVLALELAHAIAELIKRAPKMRKEDLSVVTLPGLRDEDLGTLGEDCEALS